MSLLAWFILGVFIGNAQNAFIYRFPRGIPLLHAASRCLQCHIPLAAYDNIPILSFIFRRGRCKSCRAPTNPRYVLIELATGVLFAALFHRWQDNNLWLLVASLASINLILIALINWDTYVIPGELSLTLLALGLLTSWFNPNFGGGWKGVTTASIGAATAFLVGWPATLAGRSLFGNEPVGLGDVVLISAVGSFAAWRGALFTFIIAHVLGSLWGVLLVSSKRCNLKDPIPFGPFLGLASLYHFL
ncbi:MAG: prepilin peptidase [Elusimicrobia bacterium]|nr:prepilin peptidase [Elusimicrobiota bacterium]